MRTPRLAILAVGTTAIATSTHCLAGFLPDVSQQLRVAPALVGQLTTVTAVVCAVGGPVITVATYRWNRRRLLVTALLITGLGNTLSAVAPNLPVLAAARVLTAAGMAAYIPTAVTVAATIAPAGYRARAMATVLLGVSVSLLLGVPASALLAEWLRDYRAVLAVIATICVFAAVAVALGGPNAPRPAPVPMRTRLAVAAQRRAVAILVGTTLAAAATFALYTYVVPVLTSATHAEPATITALLVCYGGGAVAGNLVSGRAADRFGPHRTVLVSIGVCALLLASLPVTASTVPGAAAAVAGWGAAFWSATAPANAWIATLSPRHGDLLVSLNATAIYVGMAGGGGIGGIVLAHAGALAVPVAAGVLAATAWTVLVMAVWWGRQHTHTASVLRSVPAAGAERASVLTRVGDDA